MNTDRHFPRERPIRGTDDAGCFWIGTAISAGSSILGGLLGRDAAEEAAELQADAINRQIDLQRDLYAQQREDVAPWLETGRAGLNRLAFLTGIGGAAAQPGDVQDELLRRFTEEDFRADPGYQFRLSEGEKAINRAAAARGMYSNPATVRELTRYGQGLADTTYQDAFNRYRAEQGDRFNRLAALSGMGQTATNQLQSAAQNYASGAGRALADLGAAQASGVLSGANALVQGLTGAGAGIGNQLAFNRGMQAFGNVPMTGGQPSYYQGAQPVMAFGYGGR